jgi:maleylpyruvate isomerase
VPVSVSAMTSRDLDRDVAGCAGAHQRLLADLHDLTDDAVSRPSLLPLWTVGHVLTHLARNAESHVRMIEGAARGEVVAQYDSQEARDADIDAGASRTARELVSDVRTTIYALEGCWASANAAAWEGQGLARSGPLAITELPFLRWREVEVHHADLGMVTPAFTSSDWSPEYVRLELARMEMTYLSRRPMGLTSMPPAALAAPPHRRLAWLLGRAEIDGLSPAGIF